MASNDKSDKSAVSATVYISSHKLQHHNARATLALALIEPPVCPKIGVSALCSVPYIGSRYLILYDLQCIERVSNQFI